MRAPATRRKGFIGGFLDGFIGTPTVPRNSPDAARAKELYRLGWRIGQLTGYDGRDLGPVEVAARVGDPGRAGAVLTVRDHAGHESVFMADRIRDFRWYDPGNRHIAFGFGATGIMAGRDRADDRSLPGSLGRVHSPGRRGLHDPAGDPLATPG